MDTSTTLNTTTTSTNEGTMICLCWLTPKVAKFQIRSFQFVDMNEGKAQKAYD